NNVQIWSVFMKVTKDAIIDEAIAILEEKGDDPQKLTIRELAGRLGIGVGLVNYHFGSKEVLVNRCVKKMIMSIVEEFHKVRTSLAYMKPKEKLNYLCLMTFDYLYTKPNVSKVALIYDLGNTSNDDTTSELIDAYIPIVKDCKPSYDDQKAYLIASRVIYIIEQSFLRTDVIRLRSGVDLSNSEERKEYLENLLKDLMK
ncbi:MAG: TetR/AcrR family transcriptional regulator, partial [Clostridia bacterium]|nr:TetR/AcrR family transcriptional regulator [Clostridia bacterium]